MNRDVKEFVRALRGRGVAVSERSKHLMLRLPNGKVAFCPRTPSDHRSLLNLKSELRKKGLEI